MEIRRWFTGHLVTEKKEMSEPVQSAHLLLMSRVGVGRERRVVRPALEPAEATGRRLPRWSCPTPDRRRARPHAKFSAMLLNAPRGSRARLDEALLAPQRSSRFSASRPRPGSCNPPAHEVLIARSARNGDDNARRARIS